jgi:hypothetical protein
MSPARDTPDQARASQFIQHDGGARINTQADAANDPGQPLPPPEHGARWMWWLYAAGIAAGLLGSYLKPWGWAA